MYRIPIYKILLVKDSNQAATSKNITGPGVAHEILANYLAGQDRENFVVLLLDTKNRVIGINTVSVGTLNSTIVHPREVFKPAILANANAIILGHNHPSGDTTPSQADIDITKNLVEAGKILNIEVLDHIIVGHDRFTSLQEKNLL